MNITIHSILSNLKKRKTLAAFRFVGLLIGFTVFLYILGLNTREKSYDRFWEDADRIYRTSLSLSQNGELMTRSAKNFPGSVHLLKEEIPGIETACTFYKDVITIFTEQKQFSDVQWLWSDTTFFNVFPRKIIEASSFNLFSNIHGVMLSESFARKLFGNEDPLQKVFKLNEGWEFVIIGVFEDIPANSHLSVDVIAGVNSLWYYLSHFDNKTGKLNDNPEYRPSKLDPYAQGAWSAPAEYRPYCYLKLAENTAIRTVEQQIPVAMEKIALPKHLADTDIKFELQPVSEIHLRSHLEHEYQTNGSQSRVNFLYLIALVVLLVSTVNFINLSSISCMESGKQFAIRMINGASELSVALILFFENFMLSLVALLFSSGLAVWGTIEMQEGLIFYLENNLLLLAFVLVIALVATLIPYYSTLKGRFPDYLKTQTKTLPGNWKGRKSLVGLQFTISIILIAGTLLIDKQLSFMSNYSLGFQPEQTLFSLSPMSMNGKPDIVSRLSAFKTEVRKIPGVKDFAVSSSIPGKEISRYAEDLRLDENAEPLPEVFQLVSASEDYTSVFQLNLLAGTNLSEQKEWQSNEILINDLAAKTMGFANPADAVGQYIGFRGKVKQIAGVFANYHHLSLKNEIAPMILAQDLEWDYSVGYYTLRYEARRTADVLAAVGRLWEDIYPGETADFQFTDERFASQYRDERLFNRLLTTSSLIALFVSCIGLFAIASFDTKKRVREIGIRKVNGAKTSEILTLLNKDFVKWTTVAFVIATPISWYAMNKWLENFAYKTTLSWWIFALAGLLALGIALLTVSWQSWRAATRNPVEALRNE
ncbi:putative ABC transport system permease protein [Mariniphaga anaerophila]|uniref:Putative ABC transport system permease protein n=1 Tax=Mariniphaga anaerophila TaxID=1484053 RepID=A0A1M5B6S0_9BACT|nr:ABC transporter permease [Mariniphaga anaerophila]SHF38145.1 putative ABC transport system permease protein [Mariniphaga anaerophila]